ncbi:MAG TPA: antibiotic biosynthesis monooxygenase [Pseudonocardiaceae bacterium]|nr:antibiotic biosynthesis monooxygenase [Pseudonocardiaceae bacterium]
MTIARIWSARTADPSNADAYQDLFPAAELAAVPGFQGAYLLRREHDSGVEFVTVTLFESFDAVRGFAGDTYEKSHVSPAAREVLDDIDDEVRHFTVVFSC